MTGCHPQVPSDKISKRNGLSLGLARILQRIKTFGERHVLGFLLAIRVWVTLSYEFNSRNIVLLLQKEGVCCAAWCFSFCSGILKNISSCILRQMMRRVLQLGEKVLRRPSFMAYICLGGLHSKKGLEWVARHSRNACLLALL